MLAMNLGKWLRGLVMAGATLALVGCGGGGGGCTDVFGGGCGTGDGTGGGGGTGTTNAKLSVSLSTATVTAGAPATVTAKLVDAQGGGIGGQVVNFSAVGSLGEFSAPAALTDDSGVAVVSLRPKDSASTGADSVLASATVNGEQITGSAGFQLTATQVAIESFVADIPTLQAYEQTALTVKLSGVTVGTPVNVSVASSCVAKNRATLTPATATTSTGTATFTYRDAGCGSFDTVDNLQASVEGAPVVASLQLNLTAPAVSSVSFVSASPPW